MSIVITRALFCDRCANWYDGGDPLALAPDIRREAARHGWKRRQGKDICPDEHDEPAAPQAPAEPTAHEVQIREDVASVRSPGWYIAECDACDWTTSGSEPVVEVAAAEHEEVARG